MSKKKKEVITLGVPSRALRIQNACCPNEHSLMDPTHTINGYASVKVLLRSGEKEGVIYLDPVYGSFSNVQDFDPSDGTIVEFYCPECQVNLESSEYKCAECGSSMFEIHLPNGGRVAGCLKNGCHYHVLKLEGGKELFDRLQQDEALDLFL